MSHPPTDHFLTARRLWENVESFEPGQKVIVSGADLSISTVVAVSRGGCQPHLTEDEATLARINESVKQLGEYLDQGHSVYGVNTGFGGSADSRTTEMHKLQVALLQLTQSGILLDPATTSPPETSTETTATPLSWVRAAMLVRCNATARGHSAVTAVLHALLRLLRRDLTPVVPLRGTISASGDLMPLAYIAGALEGNPDVLVHRRDGPVVGADEALAREGIAKTVFGPKEALGLVNGTASSAALAALVVYDAHQLAVLAQAFTAMAVEGLAGNAESFHLFIAAVRPHAGQIEASGNILAFLRGSSFAKGLTGPKDRNPSGLAQDRYALRSAPQWIGPQLEDLLSADVQVTTELNSSADNPLLDVEAKEIHYGANFQAAAVTSATEKTRLALQMLGRLFFTQSTELIDPSLNNGLPTNLAADDPSTSFTMKGADVNMASYMSELGVLASPVSPHVQTAEMHNQSVNSLAFLSARMTGKAVEVVSMMGATCLYVGCQALDLRALQADFFSEFWPAVEKTTARLLASHLTETEIKRLNSDLVERIGETWKSASRLDVGGRIKAIGDAATLSLLRTLSAASQTKSGSLALGTVETWRQEVENKATAIYQTVSRSFFARPSTETHIGVGSRALYRTIRHELGVPFHQGLAEHPGAEDGVIYGDSKRPRKTIGSWISVIYQALVEGRIYGALYDVIGEEKRSGQENGHDNGFSDAQINGTVNGEANGSA